MVAAARTVVAAAATVVSNGFLAGSDVAVLKKHAADESPSLRPLIASLPPRRR